MFVLLTLNGVQHAFSYIFRAANAPRRIKRQGEIAEALNARPNIYRLGGNKIFTTELEPHRIREFLKEGQATSYDSVERVSLPGIGELQLLNTSDMVLIPKQAADVEALMIKGHWPKWWGGKSLAYEIPNNAPKKRTFRFCPDRVGPLNLANLQITIDVGNPTEYNSGSAKVKTFHATFDHLQPSDDPYNVMGNVRNSRDLIGGNESMNISIVDYGDGVTGFQLSWNNKYVNPWYLDPNAPSEDSLLEVKNIVKRFFIDRLVGDGHRNALEDTNFDSGFPNAFVELEIQDKYDHTKVKYPISEVRVP